MNIAIQVADLDGKRIDGTRVYILELLNRFGEVDRQDHFFPYHRGMFNPLLTPKMFSNYTVQSIHFPIFWTQTRFALELFRVRPDRLWMPMQAIPLVRPRGMETIVTIHDLAFRKFPTHFPKGDLRRLIFFTDQAVRKSDRIIAISESTKRDILEYYPDIQEDKVRVVYHGYGERHYHSQSETQNTPFQFDKISSLTSQDPRYILYVGAIHPRKNLEVLVHAFEKLKRNSRYEDLKLVLAGEKAWLWDGVLRTIEISPYRKDITITGTISFAEREDFYRNASVFVFPSLYEGFGLPILESFARNIPVVCANNSSLSEVGGEGAVYFDAVSSEDLVEKLQRVLEDETFRSHCTAKGHLQLQKFSWDKCARETLEVIRGEI